MVRGFGAGIPRQSCTGDCPDEQGNLSNVKSAGEGVLEYRIDFGPGYRVYFGRDGNTLVILLTGGTKKRQQRDIVTAQEYWRDYKQSKRGRR